MSGVRMPSMVPNMLPRPRFTSMRKNMTDQKGEEAGKWVMASVKAMKAKPVPWTTWKAEETQPDETTALSCFTAEATSPFLGGFYCESMEAQE